MAKITEIAPDVFHISIFVPQISLQFNHFLVRDDEPLLFHTGYRRTFAEMQEAVATLIDPSKLRWISFSHFESDECGALNQWLAVAPKAEAATGLVGAMVNLNDFADRPARVLSPQDVIETGKYRFRYFSTPQLPHGWDAGVMFEETQRTLFCSDLFHHNGDVEPLTHNSILDRVRNTLAEFQQGPLANYVPYTSNTGRMLTSLSELRPRTLAVMHGSSYAGDCADALRQLAGIMKEVLGESAQASGAL
jgi:flavorubredoxin